jgi:hypothetical protein
MDKVHKLHAMHLMYLKLKQSPIEKDTLEDELLLALPWAIGTIWHEWLGGSDTEELIRLGVLREGDDGLEVSR